MSSATHTLADLYNSVINYGYIVRKYNYDGLAMWNLLKNPLSKVFHGNNPGEWATSRKQIEDEYKNIEKSGFIGHLDETPDMDHNQWEREHFLVQHVRILFKSPQPTIVKYLQVGYNTGQLNAELEVNPDFYEKYMDKVTAFTNIDRYIPSEIMQTPISDLQMGNNKMAMDTKNALNGVFNLLQEHTKQEGGSKTLTLNFSGTNCI